MLVSFLCLKKLRIKVGRRGGGGWIHIFYAKAAKNARSNKNTFTFFFGLPAQKENYKDLFVSTGVSSLPQLQVFYKYGRTLRSYTR